MNLSENIAFVLHEQWRRTRLKEDGTYESRWKGIKDLNFSTELEGEELPKYIRKTESGSYEIDIANACYTQLSEDWKNENKAAAEVVAGIIQSGKELTREEIGEIIHNAWLERNAWAKDGELGVPFAELSKEEQDKDLVQYDVGLTMSRATLVNYSINKLDDAIILLKHAKMYGKNISCVFNGNMLYSEFDTVDTCYLKVCRFNKKDFEESREKSMKEFEEMNTRAEEKTEGKLTEWKKRGEALIYPEKKTDWNKCAESRANGLYKGLELASAIDVMEALEQGELVENVTKIAENANHSGASWGMMMKIVTNFSKRGPEFYRANYKGEINQETEQFLQQLESQNKQFETLHAKGQDADRTM